MNARMRLLYLTNGLLIRAAGALIEHGERWEQQAARRLDALNVMRDRGYT